MVKRSRLPLRGIRFPRLMALAPPGWNGYKPSRSTKLGWQRAAYAASLVSVPEPGVDIEYEARGPFLYDWKGATT